MFFHLTGLKCVGINKKIGKEEDCRKVYNDLKTKKNISNYDIETSIKKFTKNNPHYLILRDSIDSRDSVGGKKSRRLRRI